MASADDELATGAELPVALGAALPAACTGLPATDAEPPVAGAEQLAACPEVEAEDLGLTELACSSFANKFPGDSFSCEICVVLKSKCCQYVEQNLVSPAFFEQSLIVQQGRTFFGFGFGTPFADVVKQTRVEFGDRELKCHGPYSRFWIKSLLQRGATRC